jgi:pimeloyl-ACP methyl ester carboxylesterase
MRSLSPYTLLFALVTGYGVPAFAQEPAPRGAEQDTAEFRKLNRFIAFSRQRYATNYAVTGPNAIDESRYVHIGGIDQWITIRGVDRRNPVLLLLHGGPGEATNPWSYVSLRSWFEKFTVVQWDQRGAGRTLGRNGPSLAPTITIDRMVQDGVELSDLLRTTLNVDKIVLVGHSWGSILGVYMAKAHPELFHAFVGTGQVVDPARNYVVAYDELLKAAQAKGEQNAVRELTTVGRPPWSDGRGYQVERKWANIFEHADLFLPSTFALALETPGYTLRDANDWLDGQGLSAEQLVPQTSAGVLDPKTLAGDFRLPVFVIQGATDFTTPTSLARSFVASINAPRKEFVTIPDAGHFALFMKADAFLTELVRLVSPLVKRP